MLEAINLTCVRGERSLFTGLSFRIESGQCLVVRGANGSGKTSLLRVLAGLMPPTDGSVHWRGKAIDRANEQYRRELLYLGHAPALKAALSAAENLAFSASLADEPVSTTAIDDALRQAGLQGHEDLLVGTLSEGQKRRVNLSRLLLQRRAMWVMDEPFTALDAKAADWAAELINHHLAGGGAAVLTTHQEVKLAYPTQSIRMGA